MKRLLLFACSILISVAVMAQTKPATETAAPKHRIGLVNEYTIKPGMMNEFLVWAQNESRPLYLKAGIKELYFFTNVYGDRAIVTVTEVHDSFAALKERNEAFNKNNSAEVRASWGAKAGGYIEHTRTFIVETLPELSWRNPKMQGIAPYTVLTYLYIAPQRRQDYEAFLKNDWLPLVKKADTNGLVVSRLRYGGDPSQYAVFTRVDDLTELDQPGKIAQAMGAEARAKIQQKMVGIVLRTENRILRLRADISILPTPILAEKK